MRFMWTFVIVGTACGGAPRSGSGAKPAPLRVAIRVEHLPDSDGWRMTYTLAEPMTTLEFARGTYPFRRSNWSVRAPVALGRDAQGDILTAASPIDGFTIDIPTYHRMPEKDYQFLFAFTDGSSLLYTGQLDVGPPGDRSAETTFTFVPRAGERVIVHGAVHEGPTEWRDPGDGTYVYFGSTTPEVTPDVINVVDAGAPAWLRDRTRELLPKYFALYGRRTGQALDVKPTVYLSWGKVDGELSRSYAGNVLPGIIQLDVSLGSALQGAPDAETLERVVHDAAHEAAHLWNAQMFTNGGGDWLNEGGAEAFALRASRELGAMTDDEARAALSTAVSSCLLGLGGQALKDSSVPGRTKNYYDCGLTLGLFTEAAVQKKHPGWNILDFWQRLFAAASAKGRHYDDALYYQVLGELADPEAAAFVRRVVGEPLADPREIVRALESRGVRIAEDDTAATATYGYRARLATCVAIVHQDCDDDALEASGSTCSVVDASRCRTLRAGASPRTIDGIDLATDSLHAYDEVARACAQGAPLRVRVGKDLDEAQVTCRTPVPRRVPYAVVSAPF